jgi:DNA-binding MarR family transcriptional regulator
LVRQACDLDLLVFLYRHPRTLLTSEQLAKFVGYSMKDVAVAVDEFTNAGLIERSAQPSAHAARMYLLVLEGPTGGGLKAFLDLACTCQGRRDILEVLNGKNGAGKTGASQQLAEVIELRREKIA